MVTMGAIGKKIRIAKDTIPTMHNSHRHSTRRNGSTSSTRNRMGRVLVIVTVSSKSRTTWGRAIRQVGEKPSNLYIICK